MLGCAQEYRAVINWRATGSPYTSPQVGALTDVRWTRTLNDISTGQIEIAKARAGAACCEQLAGVEPAMHELAIWRDADLVWEGPILQPVEETRDSLIVPAVDVLGWLERCGNTQLLRYVNANPDAGGRRRGPVQWIAEHIITANLTSPLSVPADYPRILDYIVREDADQDTRIEKDGSSNDAVWCTSVLNILNELTKRGLEYTTVGRSLLLRGPRGPEVAAQGRLTLDHVQGDVRVIKDGSAAATYAWATSQRSNNITEGEAVGYGQVGTPYGRLDVIEQSNTDADAEELEQIARQALRGRYPAPLLVSVPNQASLTPTSPLSIHHLVAGERIDVDTTGYCMGTVAPFVLADVDVTWGAAGEQVRVGLVPALGEVA